MNTTKKHYVHFYSPGTFFNEETSRPIESWSTSVACEMANAIQERYGAKPYGFEFETYLEADPIPDGQGGTMNVEPKRLEKSPLHWLGGTVVRYDDILDNNDTSILRSNMRCNGYPLVVENRNSYRYTMYFDEDAVILGPSGEIVRRGNDSDLAEYRAKKLTEWKSESEVTR